MRSRGFALIVVLWFLTLIAAIGIYLLANARSETALAHNLVASAHAEALADAGIAEAVFKVTEPDPNKQWPLDGVRREVHLSGGTLDVRAVDEGGKINPNKASDKLIAALFEVLGVDVSKATHLGASIADWVHPGDQPRTYGAKREQYSDAGKDYGPPNAPLETLDELQLVLGMTPELLNTARPYLTIYADEAVPNSKTAPAVVQRALAIAGKAGQAPDAGTQPAAQPPPQGDAAENANPSPAAASGGAQPTDSAAAGNAAPAMTIEIDVAAHSFDGGNFIRRAVVRLDPQNPKGYVVLDWRRVTED